MQSSDIPKGDSCRGPQQMREPPLELLWDLRSGALGRRGWAHVSRGCGTVMWGQMGHAGGRMGGGRRDAGGWAGDPGI